MRRFLDRRLLGIGTIVAALVFFVAFQVFSQTAFRGLQVDLTEDRLYTLSRATRDVLSDLQEPVTLRLYRSSQIKELGPYLVSYAQRVEELLREYVELSNGRLRLEVYDPQPYSPEEDMAVADGLRGIPVSVEGDQLYFGLTGVNSTDDRKSITYLAPERAGFLEYDLTRLIFDLANPDKPVVAVIGDLPLMGDRATRFQPWGSMQAVEQFFAVRTPGGDVQHIEDDVDLLLLAQPATMSEATRYAVDQFALKGGRILVFADPLAEHGSPQPQAPPPGFEGLAPLLAAWKIELSADQVVGDRRLATPVQAQNNGRTVVVDYPFWLDLGQDQFAAGSIVLANLTRLALWTPGRIGVAEGSAFALEPLVTTTTDGATFATDAIRFEVDLGKLYAGFQPGGAPLVLAAHLTGRPASAFPDGPPSSVTDEAVRSAHLAEADAPVHLILVADSDLLADDTWLRQQATLGQQYAVPFANNGDFVVNALEFLSGSPGLMSLRGRGLTDRPFEVIEVMQQQAEQRFRATEQQLLDEITATETQIRELQQQEREGGVLLTAEQQQAADSFRAKVLDLRGQLRDVRHELRSDVEALATRLKLLNIWAVPALVALLAVVLALVRQRRAVSARRAAHA